jgi:hypothetical protein
MYLAALHFNENCNKQQAKTKDGRLQWESELPKSKEGINWDREASESREHIW